jgi:hypothetical protein
MNNVCGCGWLLDLSGRAGVQIAVSPWSPKEPSALAPGAEQDLTTDLRFCEPWLQSKAFYLSRPLIQTN